METYSYVYTGSRLIQETVTTVTTTDEGTETTTDTLEYTYGAVGPTMVTWNGTTYYYAFNAQSDLLTAYNGVTWQYVTIGNLTNDGTWTYTWQNGRELASMSNGSTTWRYIYDANGMRTSRSFVRFAFC